MELHRPQRLSDTDAFDTETMAAISGRQSKWRTAFRPDAEEKRAAADSQVQELSERWLSGPYQRLEELRLHSRIKIASRNSS